MQVTFEKTIWRDRLRDITASIPNGISIFFDQPPPNLIPKLCALLTEAYHAGRSNTPLDFETIIKDVGSNLLPDSWEGPECVECAGFPGHSDHCSKRGK